MKVEIAVSINPEVALVLSSIINLEHKHWSFKYGTSEKTISELKNLSEQLSKVAIKHINFDEI